MIGQTRAGFTVIEVMLFLAISGVMMVGLLAGTGAAIQSQQYRDAVQSYANFLRDQYSKVITVANDRINEPCPLLDGDVTQRGSSRCVIVGRYVTTGGTEGSAAAGEEYEARPIFALEQSEGQWTYGVGTVPDRGYRTNWSVKTSLAGEPVGAGFSMVMWRDPARGMLRMAVSPGFAGSDMNGFIEQHRTTSPVNQELCVERSGLAVGQAQSVFIDSSAGSGDAVRVGNSTERCGA